MTRYRSSCNVKSVTCKLLRQHFGAAAGHVDQIAQDARAFVQYEIGLLLVFRNFLAFLEWLQTTRHTAFIFARETLIFLLVTLLPAYGFIKRDLRALGFFFESL